jgi:hypothetical protein
MVPLISIFSAAIYTKYWENTYKTLSNSQIDFEIVYAGHVVPQISLPPNFKFIRTDANPARAAHMAFSQTIGKYVIHMVDDLVPQEDFLQKMLQSMLESDEQHTIITGNYKKKDTNPLMPITPPGFGIMPITMMITKTLFINLGGFDRRFINTGWEADIALRLFYKNGTVIRSSAWLYEHLDNKRNRLSQKSSKDFDLCQTLWPKCIVKEYCDLNEVKNGRTDRIMPYTPERKTTGF